MRRTGRNAWIMALAVTLFTMGAVPSGRALAAGPERYSVGHGDLLRVSVIQWPEYSTDARVDDSGEISLPGLGQIKVAGSDVQRIGEMVTELLAQAKEARSARAVVWVAEFRPISVLGAVNAPGRYPYASGTTVLHALAMAGGPLVTSAKRDLTDIAEGRERLEVLKLQLWASLARRERLLAEERNSPGVEFSEDLKRRMAMLGQSDLLEREKHIFAVHQENLASQLSSIKERRKILQEEVDTLKQHGREIQSSIEKVSGELQRMKSALDRGIVRRMDIVTLEKQETDLQGNTRATVISISRAQQELSNIEKQTVAVQNEQRARIRQELIDVSSAIAAAEVRIQSQSQISLDTLNAPPAGSEDASHRLSSLSYVIMRSDANGGRSLVKADEMARVMPGDILKVMIPPDDSIGPHAMSSR